MEFTTSNISLLITTLLFGLVAGLCFTWGNTVTPGIGQLDEMGYLQAFQKMNRSIENPLFFLVFMGSSLIGIAMVFMNRGITPTHFWLVTAAVAIYFVGVVLITVFGNVPLNQVLDKTDLINSSAQQLASLREKFEQPWNQFHRIRVVSATISFTLLLIAGIGK
ncbi:DUF1772 domain-containing protein [Flagellimonas meishanensis]|uniref:anthrone oxygenase family protein n=1 Tax=Flagellimonas meishanensis TaxID=2873264 RepID=UPI001CA765C5|nr:DUF1772 domain-containing protein [[Muricauda] meishanensis]